MYFLRMSGRWTRASAILGACGIAGLFALWYFAARVPPIPQHPLRIGFENNPPLQIRTDSGFSGLSVETVNEAARRAGIKLDWVETGTSSEEAFRKGLVDLWPLMVDLPDRRKYVHFARPWMHSSHVLLLREGTPTPDPSFRGRIAVFKMPLHVRLLRDRFPQAQIVETPEIRWHCKASLHGGCRRGFFRSASGAERACGRSLRSALRRCFASRQFRT